MKSIKISVLSRIILVIAGILFFVAIFFPMWQIQLTAPQYPEGLVLKLFANKIDGNVDIINGLNHYIGMKTLHTEDFFEFKFLSYVFIAFGVFAILVAIIAKRKWLVALFISLFVFVCLAGIDFYRWNYDYGHNLNPDAAIKVPGMAYQPPVLGYKQLLNFGAYSIPDIGGWLMIIAGSLIFILIIKEYHMLKRIFRRNKVVSAAMLIGFFIVSCTNPGAEPIHLNKDRCSHCEMVISNGKFGAEVITNKGRIYKFDDLGCMVNYITKNGKSNFKSFYVHDYDKENILVDATTTFIVHSETLRSPMRGDFAAFVSQDKAENLAKQTNTKVLNWSTVSK